MKQIDNFDGYFVTKDGKIFSTRKTKNFIELKTNVDKKTGYVFVMFNINGKSYRKTVHRIVAKSFIPNPENKEQVNHIDGNKQNNNISNLEWNTRSENMQHAYKTGLNKGVESQNKHSSKNK